MDNFVGKLKKQRVVKTPINVLVKGGVPSWGSSEGLLSEGGGGRLVLRGMLGRFVRRR